MLSTPQVPVRDFGLVDVQTLRDTCLAAMYKMRDAGGSTSTIAMLLSRPGGSPRGRTVPCCFVFVCVEVRSQRHPDLTH